MIRNRILALGLLFALCLPACRAAGTASSSASLSDFNPVKGYDVCWTSQSGNSSESMPCGGGDIGLNVWVENGELLFYVNRSGTFDEDNTLLKLGRVRISFEQPLDSGLFCQMLQLEKGRVLIWAGDEEARTGIEVWTDVFQPVVHVDIHSPVKQRIRAAYESWRYEDRPLRKNEGFMTSYKWAPPRGLMVKGDQIEAHRRHITFLHQNPESPTMLDVTAEEQGMEALKDSLYNPIANLVFGGRLSGKGLRFEDVVDGSYLDTDYKAFRLKSRPGRHHRVQLTLCTLQGEKGTAPAKIRKQWLKALARQARRVRYDRDQARTLAWWQQFWNRSYIRINTDSERADDASCQAWEVGRNYQLFRYQLACNAYGQWPTKFNGGLLTFDPVFVNAQRPFSPDFRNWGGGTFTAQNQRLVYFPMLKSGDVDMMVPPFEFYRRLQRNAELRSRHYWQHGGACFTEQMENFGLPNPSEYTWKRPADSDAGVEYNKWLEYLWDTSLEFCYMILEARRYGGMDIGEYIPLIESCLTFFDEHYRYEARQRGEPELDDEGCLKIYPGSGCETYKLALNPASTVAALRVLTESLLDYPLNDSQRQRWTAFLATVPQLPVREVDGYRMLAPAAAWDRVNNTEAPQLYPVFPWHIVGVDSPDRELAVNAYWHDPDVRKFYSHVGWKQYNIFAACLGLRDEAKSLTLQKFADGPHRFPTFWGPGFDWTPDHNWGGSAMIGLQEMLLQCSGDRLILFPAWPRDWDVSFKLHAPGQTVVEATLKDGEMTALKVTPAEREKDIINWINR